MRIKHALWIAPLLLLQTTGWGGVCFAQSGLANSPEGGRLEAVSAPLSGVLVAAVMPKSADEAVQPEAVTYNAESAPNEAAEPTPAASNSGTTAFSRIGIGVKVSTLGAGIEVATPLAQKFNLRGGFNMMRLNHTITDNGILYAGQLRFTSGEAHLDWFPFWGFHVSPGLLFYNGDELTANAAVPGLQTFSVGGTTYESDPAVPVTGTAKLDFVKVSPSIMLGVGNLIPRSGRHYSFLFEVGGAYQGSARVGLNLAGNICTPGTPPTACHSIASDATAQANILAQQVKIQHDINPYRFYPVISIGVGFNFNL